MGRREIIITGLFTILAVGGGAVVTGLSTTANTYTPYLLSVGWLALLTAAGGLVYMFRTAPKVALTAAQEALAGPASREFVADEITSGVLRKKVEGRTSLQVDAISKTYQGQWKKMEGRVKDVSALLNSRTLVLLTPDDDDEMWGRASIQFDKEWREQVSALNVGDWISAVGKIEKIRGWLDLVDGEIVHMGEPPKKPAPAPRPSRKKPAAKPSAQ